MLIVFFIMGKSMANSGDVTLGLFYIWAQDFILEATCYDAECWENMPLLYV